MSYASGPLNERLSERDERLRSEYRPSSPTHRHSYSPVNAPHPLSPQGKHSSRPSSSASITLPPMASPRFAPPPSPTINGSLHNGSVYHQRETSGSTRYDPLSEHRESVPNWRKSPQQMRSPQEVCIFCLTNLVAPSPTPRFANRLV